MTNKQEDLSRTHYLADLRKRFTDLKIVNFYHQKDSPVGEIPLTNQVPVVIPDSATVQVEVPAIIGQGINYPALSKDLIEKRYHFIHTIIGKTTDVVIKRYPNLEPKQISDQALKDITYLIMKKHSHISEWVMHAMSDFNNLYHEAALRNATINDLLVNHHDTLNVVTQSTLLNTCSIQGNLANIKLLYNDPYYNEVYNGYLPFEEYHIKN